MTDEWSLIAERNALAELRLSCGKEKFKNTKGFRLRNETLCMHKIIILSIESV